MNRETEVVAVDISVAVGWKRDAVPGPVTNSNSNSDSDSPSLGSVT
jgi:hypothetical protein